MTSVMLDDAEQAERIRREHPIGRIGEPAEVAAAIAFLRSDDASFITGATLCSLTSIPVARPGTMK